MGSEGVDEENHDEEIKRIQRPTQDPAETAYPRPFWGSTRLPGRRLVSMVSLSGQTCGGEFSSKLECRSLNVQLKLFNKLLRSFTREKVLFELPGCSCSKLRRRSDILALPCPPTGLRE